jgi:hypothetical protein
MRYGCEAKEVSIDDVVGDMAIPTLRTGRHDGFVRRPFPGFEDGMPRHFPSRVRVVEARSSLVHVYLSHVRVSASVHMYIWSCCCEYRVFV